MCFSGVGDDFRLDYYRAITDYSAFGRIARTTFRQLGTTDFVRTVINPLGLSCPLGGEL